ncbi:MULTISPECIES: hypothetical protein [Halomonadaceae]|uniref:hypothetical protein n=1 Tax=Halomonadaceae TaxID=28256 RepID=UPI0015980BB7|nr:MULTISPECIES: hypothetical protein [Halomonas]QJQ94973.1 hypothetical protein HIO72_06615 [Halomonas sp. PA5]
MNPFATRWRYPIVALGLIAGLQAPSAHAFFPELDIDYQLDHVLVQTSLYTRHFSPDPSHNNDQELISLELHTPDRWLAGGARFINSHDQESFYVYVGREFPFWQPSENFEIRGKLTGGLLHGYRGEYRDNIPLNRYGTAPALLPSVGMRWGPIEADLIVFGTAGMMVLGGVRF